MVLQKRVRNETIHIRTETQLSHIGERERRETYADNQKAAYMGRGKSTKGEPGFDVQAPPEPPKSLSTTKKEKSSELKRGKGLGFLGSTIHIQEKKRRGAPPPRNLLG